MNKSTWGMSVTTALLAVFVGFTGWAEEPVAPQLTVPSEPPVPITLDACQKYAQRMVSEWSELNTRIYLFPQGAMEDKYEDKVGKQFISTVLYGSGIVKSADREPQGIQYTCLLEKQDKALFFHWTDTMFPSPVQTCQVQKTAVETSQCLKLLYESHETKRLALEEKAAATGKPQVAVSRNQWEAYRTAECDARMATQAQRPERFVYYDCMITKTRERLEDLGSYQ